MARNNQRGYKFYVVVDRKAGGRCIESGWEYREDAADQVRELRADGLAPRVLTKRGLKQDPNDNGIWCRLGEV